MISMQVACNITQKIAPNGLNDRARSTDERAPYNRAILPDLYKISQSIFCFVRWVSKTMEINNETRFAHKSVR